jgi:hypothetical protein
MSCLKLARLSNQPTYIYCIIGEYSPPPFYACHPHPVSPKLCLEENKKFWEELIGYSPFTVMFVFVTKRRTKDVGLYA